MPILLQWQSAWEQFPRLSGGCGSVESRPNAAGTSEVHPS